jgi:prepilin-type N-terminal cleavage/methylation domain-containing protein/prepilin-type processing-associated H-X9-DG protein
MGLKAFTLLELLVVVSIIALLAALLLPVLNRAHARAHAVSCLNNLRQMQLSWQLYTDDFSGFVPPNSSYVANGIWRSTPESWIGNSSALFDRDTTEIKNGLIFRYDYNRVVATYHCPADDSTVAGTDLPRTRSYSMSRSIGGNYITNTQQEQMVIKQASQVRAPSKLFVFIDESEDSIDDAHFLVPPNPETRWLNLPADRHGKGCVLSFVDGHVERLKWLWPKSFSKNSSHAKDAENREDLADLRRLQELANPASD